MDCGTVWLSEGDNDNSRMNGVQQRNCVVKVAVGSQNSCAYALSRNKHRIVIVSKIAYSIKTHDLMSAFVYQVCGRQGKILV